MNVFAYHQEDETKTLIHIDKWVVNYGIHIDGYCRICHQTVYIKAATSQKQTHFSHYKGSECPSIADNHKPYEMLSTLPRDEALATA